MNWLQKMANTIQDISEFLREQDGFAHLKYVRVNGAYRFGDANSFTTEHIGLANGEPVESAGFVKVSPDGLSVEGHSSQLEIGPASDDEENLSRLLNLPIQDRW